MRRKKGGSSRYTRTSDKKLITIGEIIVIIVVLVLIFRDNLGLTSGKRDAMKRESSASQSQSESIVSSEPASTTVLVHNDGEFARLNDIPDVIGVYYDIGATAYADNGIALTVTSIDDNYDKYDAKYDELSDCYRFVAVGVSYYNSSDKAEQTERVDCYYSGNALGTQAYENADETLELDAGETFEELAVFAIPKEADDFELHCVQSSSSVAIIKLS